MKIGLALGSGAARGLAHVGILKAFEEEGVKPYAITGSSMGALIGGIYASGYPIEKIEEFILNLDFGVFKNIVDFKLSRAGIVDGKKIEDFLDSVVNEKEISNLKIKFACVATDSLTGLEVIFNKGDIIKAIRASISFPGVFIPVYYDGMFLIDGGIKNPVPVDLLPDECNIKIAVDVGPFVVKDKLIKKYFKNHQTKPQKSVNESFNTLIKQIFNFNNDDTIKYPSMLETLVQTIAIMQESIYEYKIKSQKNVIEVKPDLDDYKLTDFTKAKEILEIGYNEGKKILREVKLG
ncbi:patatin-like phospholipase family protein [Deferribacterales bacterium Es71-Z0220]|uniref:patatin-like phospholipase family protein n=1 Tax=Deferrivibrio essentukiensis TaxID=2880922 RepID=UPI001F61CB79|nr:patatin-like phospholipase family protein [Deferrivibrio essentukiensis]MCB4204654.1 patatin-like phospholipase family protein [Deferrivibrio essentukiensis]